MSEQKRMAKKNRRHLRRRRLAQGISVGKRSAVALALGLGLTAAASAEAGIIYTSLGPSGQSITDGSLDFLTFPGQSYPQFYLKHIGGSSYRRAGIYSYYNNNSIVTNRSTYSAALLAKGQIIGYGLPGELSWSSAYDGVTLGGVHQDNGPYGNFLGEKGYAGLSFDLEDGTHYGWAQLFMDLEANSVTLFGYAYETEVGQEIEVGQTPLPGSLLLLASGAAGLLAYRRLTRGK